MFREDLSRNFGFVLNDVARLLRTIFDRRVKSLGLTRSQWWVLNYVYRNDGATQSELAEMLEVEKATLGRLLDRLAQKGWIRREADATDRRVKRIYLTREAERVHKRIWRIAEATVDDALADLSTQESAQLMRLLARVKKSLVAVVDGPAGHNGLAVSRAVRAHRHNGSVAP